ncbi:MAG: hypothetical protein J6J31_07550 [Thermoguttaceae bacterium]|nr:hypothetical protein [Thermoguttaceae bacterium]
MKISFLFRRLLPSSAALSGCAAVFLASAFLAAPSSGAAQNDSVLSLSDPAKLPVLGTVPAGYPDPKMTLTPDAFQTPPEGFGEVPFWWWSGDKLDKDRLAWQIRELHEKGVTGMQVNYAHKDTSQPHWPTFPNSPEIFTPEWWDFWAFAAEECGKYGMGIGLSTYTLDWTGTENLFNRIIYEDPAFHTRTLHLREVTDGNFTPSENSIGFWAYPFRGNVLTGKGIQLSTEDPAQTASENVREMLANAGNADFDSVRIWEVFWKGNPGTLDPIHPQSGARVIEKFFQPFVDHNPTKDAKGLNWFFNDELFLGVPGQCWWTEDLPEQFAKFKGYGFFDKLPALFMEVGPETGKVRMDWEDVQLHLTEVRYFKPIYSWHYDQGLVFGCDNLGRGTNPRAYGDYFRATRWYSAPGHDTPGGRADFIKGKVSSSIAALYRRPRVWLEGYHSLGWGASPQTLMTATNENFAYGCTLLNLHGLYYTTHGSMWEWAPPCYHFRMPYWKHLPVFLKNFERLSYVLSQGIWKSEIAVTYPTSPGMAGFGNEQRAATGCAFDAARKIYAAQRDVTFMDDQSVLRAEIRDGKLCVSGMEFRVYVLPGVKAIRWDVLKKLEAFANAGGILVCLDRLPDVSDRVGANDPELNALVARLFTDENAPGIFIPNRNGPEFAQLIAEKFPQDLQSAQTSGSAKFLHRQIGEQNVYFLTGIPKDTRLTFRSVGRPELWDTMTGERKTLEVIARFPVDGEMRTVLKMPVTEVEAALIVFQPDASQTAELNEKTETVSVSAEAQDTVSALKLDGAWRFRLVPTMDNQWGDFRLPVTPDNLFIGAEARRFHYAEIDDAAAAAFLDAPNGTMPESLRPLVSLDTNESSWPMCAYGFGTQFFLTKCARAKGMPSAADAASNASPYAFSWRVGVKGNPGHQGWHGTKKNISDHFIALGKGKGGHNETLYVEEDVPQNYRLSTFVRYSGTVRIQKGGNLPVRVTLDGKEIAPETETLTLDGSVQELVLEYAKAGRGFWVLEKGNPPARTAQPEEADVPPSEFRAFNTAGRLIPKEGEDEFLTRKQTGEKLAGMPLSMTWFRTDCVPFEPFAKEGKAVSDRVGVYRFTAPAGLQKMVLTLDEKAVGIPAVFVDGQQIRNLEETPSVQPRTRRLVVSLPETSCRPAKVAIAARLADSLEGGAYFAEPIRLETGEGEIPQLGDWSRDGTVLELYSGGAVYSKSFTLSKEEASAKSAILDLGMVSATAEIRINGKPVRTLVAAPWKTDVAGFLKEGENTIEIEVFNTLSNHYHSIPNRYRGNRTSGLLGPVELRFGER